MYLGIICFILLNLAPLAPGYYCATTVYAAGNPCSPHNRRIRDSLFRTTSAPSYRYYSRRTTTQPSYYATYRSSSRRTSTTPRPALWRQTPWAPNTTKSFTVLPHFIKRIRFTSSETLLGTKFNDEMKKLFSKKIPTKLFGLGVGPAFIGGAGFSFGAALVSYSVYHRYQHFRQLLHENGNLDKWDEAYYSVIYQKKRCHYDCPINSHCEWGFCECDPGYTKLWGHCHESENPEWSLSRSTLDLNKTTLSCTNIAECTVVDINLVCLNNTCTCRKDMAWNNLAMECQILLDVDCKAFSYDTTASPVIKAAFEKTGGRAKSKPTGVLDTLFSGKDIDSVKVAEESVILVSNMTIPDNRTETKEESLSGSLLKYIDAKKASRKDLEEAFCRDIDAFSEAFPVSKSSCNSCSCKEIDPLLCAVLYDSGTCSSAGWKLEVAVGTQKRLKYFSTDWKYRNDADTVGVRRGCTFTGFTGSSYDGDKLVLTAGVRDRWVVLLKSPHKLFHENIESFQCVCRG